MPELNAACHDSVPSFKCMGYFFPKMKEEDLVMNSFS